MIFNPTDLEPMPIAMPSKDDRPVDTSVRQTYAEPLTKDQIRDYAAALRMLTRLTARQLQQLRAEVIPLIQREKREKETHTTYAN